jgi:hypothetical protein
MRFLQGILAAGVAGGLAAAAFGQSRAPSMPVANQPPLTQISRDIFQLGPVRLDKNQRTVQFPAKLNLKEGVIEYLLVHDRGKSYESMLTTSAEPYYVHLAMLLIGAKGAPPTDALLNATTPQFHMNKPPGATNAPPPLAIPGDPVTIELAWETLHGRKQVRAEDCLMNLATKTNVAHSAWTYNGSRVVHGYFMAQGEGSIVAMIDDIDAMVNNPRQGSDNDQIWQINSNNVPPTNTTVEVTFKLEAPNSK